jgi:surface antigen
LLGRNCRLISGISMHLAIRALLILPALALTACATTPQLAPVTNTAPLVSAEPAVLAAPAQTTAVAASMTDVSAFVDPAVLGQLSEKSKVEAAGAQFNALQFGRVGAPRNWQGGNGQSGVVTVGPYVRVNLIDCRDFTHTVTAGGQTFARQGTACREADGSWTVSITKAG